MLAGITGLFGRGPVENKVENKRERQINGIASKFKRSKNYSRCRNCTALSISPH